MMNFLFNDKTFESCLDVIWSLHGDDALVIFESSGDSFVFYIFHNK